MKTNSICPTYLKPIEGTSTKRLRALSVVVLMGICVGAVGASAKGPRGAHEPQRRVTQFAERLGLDEATVAELREVESEGREERHAIRLRLNVLQAELRELLGSEAPAESAVMRKADAIGKLETDARKIQLRTMVRIRGLLTAEQREKLVRIHGERKRRHGRKQDGPGGRRYSGPPGPPRY